MGCLGSCKRTSVSTFMGLALLVLRGSLRLRVSIFFVKPYPILDFLHALQLISKRNDQKLGQVTEENSGYWNISFSFLTSSSESLGLEFSRIRIGLALKTPCLCAKVSGFQRKMLVSQSLKSAIRHPFNSYSPDCRLSQ